MTQLLPMLAFTAAFAVACAGRPAEVVAGSGQTEAPGEALALAGFDHGYATWGAILARHVDAEGRVDYAALQGEAGLPRFIEAIGAVAPEEVGAWSRDQQVAFYSNAYNALTFQTILDAMPIASIMDIKTRAQDPHDPWEVARWRVAGRDVSLNWIEHSKLRATLKEPRVHFVLVCAAKGCPRLPARAIVSSEVDAQLDKAARAFFRDPARNRIDRDAKKVQLSRILEWYGDDFVGWEGTPGTPTLDGRSPKEQASLRLLGAALSEEDRAWLALNTFTLSYIDYDWALNKQ